MMHISNSLRNHFPLLKKCPETVVYFDNASTTLKPISVINKMNELYTEYPVNVHRGAYRFAEQATRAFEDSRLAVQRFINARSTKEIVFTRGTTDSINLIASSYGRTFLKPGDEILLTQLEHHANIVPWRMLCDRIGSVIKVIPMKRDGELDLSNIKSLITNKTRLVGLVYVSNSLGTINPVAEIIEIAHARGAKVLVDAAQAIAHFPIDVQNLDVDFLCFSGHKMFGPFGIGVLYGKEHLLEGMPPHQGGGGMIQNVNFDEVSYAPLPSKFEAGTPPIASAVGLGEATNFINEIGFKFIQERENLLLSYTLERIKKINGLILYGESKERSAVFAFNLTGVHPHDVTAYLDQKGICIRSGHHCNQPIMTFYQIPAMNRASMSFYNTLEEIDYFIETLKETRKFFS